MRVRVRSSLVLLAALALGACGGSEASRPSSSAASTAAASSAPGVSSGKAEFGVAECDTYIKQYVACIDRMPAAAQAQARQALEQSRTAWQQAASTEQGKAALAMTCKAASDAAAPALRAQGCNW